MKFGAVAVGEAVGATLAHGLRVAEGAFKKGRVLSDADVAALAEAGYERVVVARLDADDVPEDEAAAVLATRLAGDGVDVGKAFTGRCNLFARRAGLLHVDGAAIDAMNRVDEAMTVATLSDGVRVGERELVATIKIIPFAVPRANLERAAAGLEAAGPALGVKAYRASDVALVQTTLPGTRAALLDKTARVIGARLEALGSRVRWERRCAHDTAELARTLAELLDRAPHMLLVVGASAIVDRRDVVPAAISAAGGTLDHFGMPVDPGNLLLLAHHGETPVLGLPGCARSPKFNGFDQVLERLLAGIEVGAGDIMAMGVGGLLKETHERAQPRLSARPPAARGQRPRVAALVLAAGQSKRMGARNKLLERVDGVPMVAHAVDAARAAAGGRVYVVTGHEAARIAEALAGREDVHFVHNPRYAEGLSTSLAAGLAALDADVDAALVCLGDMPRVTRAHIEALLAAFDPEEGRAICVPLWAGQRGHPVLWARRFFDDIATIKGDVGARHLLGEYADLVCEVPVADDGVLLDVDSPDALEALGAAASHDRP
ncbi:MAG: molybdopterin-binding/glycosyltransferase family 2 protein [Gammaproteobacteria bacterium]|nr:molybdopterin-binding/glycosyltransferase family 2 protein [Gammaproteobacteria bacterium]